MTMTNFNDQFIANCRKCNPQRSGFSQNANYNQSSDGKDVFKKENPKLNFLKKIQFAL